MSAAEEETPELATNEEWRLIMVRARKDHSMTQEQLGKAVGTSQVMISKIESGEAGSSSFVLAICRVLNIPEPVHFANEEQREWSQLGHVLRQQPERYRAALNLLKLMVEQEERAESEETPPPGEPRRRPH